MNTDLKTETWYREPTDHEQTRFGNYTGFVGMIDFEIAGKVLAFTVTCFTYNDKPIHFDVFRYGRDWKVMVKIMAHELNQDEVYLKPVDVLEYHRKEIERAVLKLKSE